jgi:signal transduction histidine kinase
LGNAAVGVIIVFRDIRREKEIDRAKSEFVSLASHQLRTPLTAIKLFSEMLMSGGAGSLTDEQKQILRNIEKSNRKMVELVDDLLNISRLESQKLKVSLTEFDLVSFVKGILESSEITSIVKGKKLDFVTNQTTLPVFTDANLLTQVISNLVSNAIKYSKPQTSKHTSKIEVFVDQVNEKHYCLAVKDNGIGIPKHAQKKIFTKLYRADNAIKISTDGNGLGLYMCKMMLDSIGGKIWFESEEGKGTTFYVQIPTKRQLL